MEQGRRRKKKVRTLHEKIEARRAKYDNTKLTNAIRQLFIAVDEDESGFLESHEFVTAQTAVAEIAGDGFDDDEAERAFQSIKPFDADGDSRVSLKEFSAKLSELVEAMSTDGKRELLLSFADVAAQVNGQTRRELSREVRQFFFDLDTDEDQRLGEAELGQMESILGELAQGSAVTADYLQELVSFKNFDRDKDGKVNSAAFAATLTDRLRALKVPKKDLVLKLRTLREGPRTFIFGVFLGMGRGTAYLTLDKDGWATLTEEHANAVLFKQESSEPTMIYKVAAGSWIGYYLSSDWFKGVGVYKSADDAAYWKFQEQKLVTQSFKSAGHPVTFCTENRYLYTFDEYRMVEIRTAEVTAA